MIEVTCPKCQKQMTAPEDKRGETGTCPRCGNDVPIPLPPPPPVEKPPTAWQLLTPRQRRIRVTLLVAAILLVGAPLAGFTGMAVIRALKPSKPIVFQPKPTPSTIIQDWPEGTGYVEVQIGKPDKPYEVAPASTKCVILGRDGSGFRLAGDVEVRQGKSLFIHPGATITHGFKAEGRLTLLDYNADECVLPFGVTVKVDPLGQFVPMRYDPTGLTTRPAKSK
jgi:hypothetical protein